MRRFVLGVAVLLALAACDQAAEETTTTAAGGQQAAGQTLAAVEGRSSLNCGVNDAVPGFGFVDAQGNFIGFDVDFCKAVAAAVLGDPAAVEFKPLTTEQRFTALQSGEIDVLIRNTTWTASRDGKEGATFLHTTFFDGQGLMVKTDSGVETLEDLAGTTICVLRGTTTELNLAAVFNSRAIDYEPLTFATNDELRPAFVADQCQGWTSDKSQLAGIRSTYPEADGGPEALTILEETMSKEPLGPVVRDGDSQWAHIVDWVVLATITAEEFGLDSTNIGSYTGDDASIKRFVGQPVADAQGNETVFDAGLGFPADFAVKLVQAVGNYEEIYDRNVGPDTPLGLPRGLNALWTEGGLLYAPPFR